MGMDGVYSSREPILVSSWSRLTFSCSVDILEGWFK